MAAVHAHRCPMRNMAKCRQLEIFPAQQTAIGKERSDLADARKREIEREQRHIDSKRQSRGPEAWGDPAPETRSARDEIGRIMAGLDFSGDFVKEQRSEDRRNRGPEKQRENHEQDWHK